MSTGLLTAEEVRAVCVDAVFALFICPAIVDPNALGVIDTPLITYMARSNLMQVAQIIQVLAMPGHQGEPDPKDLYGRFEREQVSTILEQMLESAKDLAAAFDHEDEDDEETDEVGMANGEGGPGMVAKTQIVFCWSFSKSRIAVKTFILDPIKHEEVCVSYFLALSKDVCS